MTAGSPQDLSRKMESVAGILEDLPKIRPSRRAALLAVGGVAYQPEARVTDYAVPLAALTQELLDELAWAASDYSQQYPNSEPSSVSEETRINLLREARSVSDEVEQDSDLSVPEQQHFKSLVQQLVAALEALPETGPNPTATAAKAIVGDSLIEGRMWSRLAGRKWLKRLGGIAAAVLMAVSAYPGGKELTHDFMSWISAHPAISSGQSPEAGETQDLIGESGETEQGQGEG